MHRREFLHVSAGALAAVGMRRLVPTPMDAAAFHASRRFAHLSAGDIAYVERGSGDVALFLHGFPLNGFQWRGALDRLAPYRRCIAPDFLALGYTRVAEGHSVTPSAQVAMIAAFLDAIGIRSADVVASDSGGMVAQLLLARYPGRVRTLLLADCDVEPDSPPAAVLPVIAMAREGTFADKWLAAWVADKNLARSAQGLGGQCYADPRHPTDEAIDCYLGPLVSSPERKALVHQYTIGLAPNSLAGVAPALEKSSVPARIVWGTADTIFVPSDADYLNRTLGGSRGVRRIPKAKLFWPEEFPDVVAEECRNLWRV